MKKVIFLMIMLVFLLPNVAAAKHMKLLAVKEERGNYIGSPADLYLEIQAGSGRVFLETFPLTKLDTQLSTRFAKEVACSFLDVSCDNYDFFYTIEADSSIVGGPSAGAAIAVLTVAALEDLDLDEKATMTGTINSGGFIGFVGGLKEKIDAAAGMGLEKVLVASADIDVKINNETMNLTSYAYEKGIELVEVISLGEAVYEFTGKYAPAIIENITIDPNYNLIMKQLAIMLCNKSSSLKKELTGLNTTEPDNLTKKGYSAIGNEKYYTGASYCFGANYKYTTLLLQNLTKEEIKEKIALTKAEIEQFNLTKEEIKTITDLQAYMIVKNRLAEAADYLNRSLENINNTNESISDLAYGIERIFSAESWTRFFGKGEKELKLDERILKSACLNKIAEAEERYSYAAIYLPTLVEDIKVKIDKASSNLENGEYELCLFKASKAKASANILLSSIGVSKAQIDKVVDAKLGLVKRTINKQIGQGVWPILGYSYYEYAHSLKEEDPYSALLYSEYALELGNLDDYLKERKRALPIIKKPKTNLMLIAVFLIGVTLGFILANTLKTKPKRKRPNPREKLRRASVLGKKR